MPSPNAQPATNGFRTEELGRREFQKAVAVVINAQGMGLHETQDKLRLNSEFMADMSKRIDEHSVSLDFEQRERAAIGQAVYEFQHRSFWHRLRWLVIGR